MAVILVTLSSATCSHWPALYCALQPPSLCSRALAALWVSSQALLAFSAGSGRERSPSPSVELHSAEKRNIKVSCLITLTTTNCTLVFNLPEQHKSKCMCGRALGWCVDKGSLRNTPPPPSPSSLPSYLLPRVVNKLLLEGKHAVNEEKLSIAATI